MIEKEIHSDWFHSTVTGSTVQNEFVAHEFKVMHNYKNKLFQLFIHNALLQNICNCSGEKLYTKLPIPEKMIS